MQTCLWLDLNLFIFLSLSLFFISIADLLTVWQADIVTEKLKEMKTEKSKQFTDRELDKLKWLTGSERGEQTSTGLWKVFNRIELIGYRFSEYGNSDNQLVLKRRKGKGKKEVFCQFLFNSNWTCNHRKVVNQLEDWQKNEKMRGWRNKCHCHMSSLPGSLCLYLFIYLFIFEIAKEPLT